jgi:hypothetical protein
MGLFSRDEEREIVDESLHLRIVREGKYIRVMIGDRSALFSGSSPEQFLQYYRAALKVIDPPFTSTSRDGRRLEFSASEQYDLRRDIALHWIRFYLVTKQQVQVRPDDLTHPQTWEIVLKKAEAKYGSRSTDAMSLAAHTVGVSLERLELWRRVEDDRLENM